MGFSLFRTVGCGNNRPFVRNSPRAWFPKFGLLPKHCCFRVRPPFERPPFSVVLPSQVLPEPGLLIEFFDDPKSDVPREAWVPSTSTCVDGRNPLTFSRGWLLSEHHAATIDPLRYRIFTEQEQTAVGLEGRDQSFRLACYLPFELWRLMVSPWFADKVPECSPAQSGWTVGPAASMPFLSSLR